MEVVVAADVANLGGLCAVVPSKTKSPNSEQDARLLLYKTEIFFGDSVSRRERAAPGSGLM